MKTRKVRGWPVRLYNIGDGERPGDAVPAIDEGGSILLYAERPALYPDRPEGRDVAQAAIRELPAYQFVRWAHNPQRMLFQRKLAGMEGVP